MSNLVIGSCALSDAGTIEDVGNELATLPGTNLLDQQPSNFTRTSGLSSIYWVGDLGASYDISYVGLLFTNFSGTGSWRVRLANSQSNLTASPAYDSGSTNPWDGITISPYTRPHLQDWQSSSTSARWWRVDVSDASNGDGYIQAGRIVVCDPWQPTLNRLIGSAAVAPIEDEQSKIGMGGQEFTRVRVRPLRAGPMILEITNAEWRDSLYLDYLQRGASEPIVYIANPSATNPELQQNTIYGRFTSLSNPDEIDANYVQVRVSIKETP